MSSSSSAADSPLRRRLVPFADPGEDELLADHPQRQELVALQAKDRLEPLDVVLAEEPVATLRRVAARAGPDPRGSGSSRSRCRGTRPAGGAQTVPIVSRRCVRGRLSRRCSFADEAQPVLADLQLRRRSRAGWPHSIRLPVDERAVEAAEILDREARRPTAQTTACLRETVTSSRKMSQSGERPIVVRSPVGMKCSPARPPPERTTSAGPSAADLIERTGPPRRRSPRACRSCVVSAPPSSLTSSAPHCEQ